MHERVRQLADNNVADWVRLDPCAAIVSGIAVAEPALTDYSEAASQDLGLLARRTRDAAAQLLSELPSGVSRTAAAVLAERCGVEADLYDTGQMQRRLDVVTCPLQQVRRALDLTPRASEEQWALLAERLVSVPASVDSYLRGLDAAASRGDVPALRQVHAVASQCERLVDSGHFADLVTGYRDGAVRSALEEGAVAAASAYSRAAKWLRQELGPRARAEEAFGRDRYSLWARWYIGADVDFEEAHAWAAREFVILEERARAAAAAIDPRASVEDVLGGLRERSDLQVRGRAAAGLWLQRCGLESFDAAGGLFDVPEQLRQLEWNVTTDGGVHYLAPAEDGSRPGTVWWAMPDGEPLLTWLARTTVVHEGVPGHHLQIGQTVLLSEHLTRFQRHRCEIAGYVEGWGLYAEQLMDELDFFDEPADQLGFLRGQFLRTARVLVDIGVHLQLDIPDDLQPIGERRWTAISARRFLSERAGLRGAFLDYELDRYLGRGGQAIAYKLGERQWLSARAAAAPRGPLGLREFHIAALQLGPVSFDQLKEAVSKL